MIAELPSVLHEVHATGVGIIGPAGVEIRRERDLRVDDDVLAARKTDDEIRPEQSSVVVTGRRLENEVAMLKHSRCLYDALELHLAPAAAHVGRTERRDEIAGLAAQTLLSVP